MNLKAENITFAYNKKRQILKDVSLTLPSDKIIGLIGDSGSGKSTLCKIMAGFISHYSGNVTIDGNKIPDKDYYPVQLIFQHPEKTMNPKWKMEKVLNESWTPTQDLKDTFGLKDNWLTRWPSELSGGELQRFSILRALNPKTKFIIADEISTMLDAVTQVQIWEALIKHCRANNIGILAVSHDPELLEVVCDDILYFKDINKL
ncbi:ABC transporter ATP-binding protein [uncultured Methanobrevibacter sp.]|uniref:ABC transporter ATP-binding protein n=1 Tax=uncultured Methanobrevibacter sp. TaxID=253161 RepID=UPI00261B3FAB|nr:ATP-binding cassette domain-containing protein [uncultured Methanobrevibacter sp.]